MYSVAKIKESSATRFIEESEEGTKVEFCVGTSPEIYGAFVRK